MELATVERPPVTTLSTIAVRCEPHSMIVIAMLKSLGDIELRIDEMKPKLLEIGAKMPETEHLLNSHNDLTTRLASKQEQVEELLARADQLVTEQKDSDIFVYEAMAESLGVAWKELNRQLELRGYILEDTLRFYQLANEHEKGKMSLSENLDDVFELLKNKDHTISLQAFDIFCMFPHELINDFLRRDDFSNAKTLLDIFASVRMVNEGFLESVIIFASNEPCAKMAAENERLMQRLYSLAKMGDPLKFVLPLTQVSRMAAETTHATLFKLQQNYFSLLTETFKACDGGLNQSERLINVAYIFLNVSQVKLACEQLFDSTEMVSMLSSFLTNPSAISSFKCIVAKILLNISYHLEMHTILLNDQFIGDIVDPFADEDDDLTTDEMDKLPLQLQYVDHKRSTSMTLLDTLVEVLARLCISKKGREKLRELGIYAILREFDKSRRGTDEALVEDKFMTLDGTPEWNLLMHTLLFDDHEIQVNGNLEHSLPTGITEFNLDDLTAELDAIERETKQKEVVEEKKEAESN